MICFFLFKIKLMQIFLWLDCTWPVQSLWGCSQWLYYLACAVFMGLFPVVVLPGLCSLYGAAPSGCTTWPAQSLWGCSQWWFNSTAPHISDWPSNNNNKLTEFNCAEYELNFSFMYSKLQWKLDTKYIK